MQKELLPWSNLPDCQRVDSVDGTAERPVENACAGKGVAKRGCKNVSARIVGSPSLLPGHCHPGGRQLPLLLTQLFLIWYMYVYMVKQNYAGACG